jgi:hypothetical protein
MDRAYWQQKADNLMIEDVRPTWHNNSLSNQAPLTSIFETLSLANQFKQ